MIKDLCKGLSAPVEFWATDEATLAIMTGGCGPGKYGDYLVPDKVWGLSIHPCCVIHDWQYATGKTMEDKKEADQNFLDNMLFLVNRDSKSTILRWLRSYRVMSYYRAVADGGDESFRAACLDPD